ncbi:acyl-CoA dehydrogenase family protein [Nocardia vaccinii]|uniref:acyl-CoA dehydrogenase family protein n=1 Tax=Nocardia vaccinii TaxID=1822 RepID=UPI00082C4E43|nr:acyl-CoA dehydrogenase family protein [Nocardia vaccinii]
MTDTDSAEIELIAESLSKAMGSASGAALDRALGELGWTEMLAEMPDVAIPLVFRLLGETGAHAPVLNDVLAQASGNPLGGTVALPFAGGSWVVWERTDQPGGTVDEDLPLHPTAPGADIPLGPGRRALAWWLIGSGRTMLALARRHALDRKQFGRPVASFQAIRHRLAETLVALEGAEATLSTADDEFGALLAKAAAGRAALLAAKHCQQTLGGIGFTAEHELQGHIRRVLVLDGLLGSTRELTREAGARIRAEGSAPRLAQL